MDDMVFTIRELLLYLMVIGIVIGALLGLIPFLLGRRRGQATLGIYGLLACTVTGAVTPIIALIAAAVFVWIIVKKKKTEGPPAEALSKSEES